MAERQHGLREMIRDELSFPLNHDLRNSSEKLRQTSTQIQGEVHELSEMIKNIEQRLERARNACVTNTNNTGARPKVSSHSTSGGTYASQPQSKHSTPLQRHSGITMGTLQNPFSLEDSYPNIQLNSMSGFTGSEYDPRLRTSGSFCDPTGIHEFSTDRKHVPFNSQHMFNSFPHENNRGSSRLAHGASLQDPFIQIRDCYPIPHSPQLHDTLNTPLHRPQIQSPTHKAVEPDKFDPKTTDWPDYMAYFEHVASWNHWSESEKAQRLIMCLRGSAQKILSELTYQQCTNYNTLIQTLNQRFNPQEREIVARCEFRNRKREEGESISQYGYALKRLAQRAFPNETSSSLEIHVIDQYLNGLGHHELKKHITFKHPKSLEQAISYASEFEAIEGSIDKLRKPTSSVDSEKVLAVRQGSKKVSFADQDLESMLSRLLDEKLEKLMTRRGESETNQCTPNSDKHQNNPETQRSIICGYCGKVGHIENRCYKKQRDQERSRPLWPEKEHVDSSPRPSTRSQEN